MLGELSRVASFIWLLVALPLAAVVLSDRAALGIASSAALFHLVFGFGETLPVIRHLGFLHFPIFATFTSSAALFAPSFLMSIFGWLLDWFGPALLLIQGVQAVRFSVYVSNNVMDYIYTAPGRVKTFVLSIAMVQLSWTIYIYYGLFMHPLLDVKSASIISSMATASACVLVASLFSPVAVPSDPAATALVAGLAVSHILPDQGQSIGLVHKTFQLFAPGNWFTLALTVFTLPLSIAPDAFTRATTEAMSQRATALVQACIVCMYARFVLSSTGHADVTNPFWHMAEGLAALAFYAGRLVAPILQAN